MITGLYVHILYLLNTSELSPLTFNTRDIHHGHPMKAASISVGLLTCGNFTLCLVIENSSSIAVVFPCPNYCSTTNMH